MVLPEDRYNFSVRAKDRVCIAITDRECLAGEKLELPPFKLIERRIHRRSGHQRLNRPADRRERKRTPDRHRPPRPVAAIGKVISPEDGDRGQRRPVHRRGRPRVRTFPTSLIFAAIAWHGTRQSNRRSW